MLGYQYLRCECPKFLTPEIRDWWWISNSVIVFFTFAHFGCFSRHTFHWFFKLRSTKDPCWTSSPRAGTERASTRELLKRKNMNLQNFNCVLCVGTTEESLLHLFLGCPFAFQCWNRMGIQVDPAVGPFQNLQNLKNQLQVPFFMEIIILMCWTIWNARNDWIFRQVSPNLQLFKSCFREELHLLSLRMKRRNLTQFNQWISNLL